ncbi:hypothetical protein [Pseudomonas sp. N8]|uniref:hypothetical protein n=1 Tax=Pseudomonas sp. N8 TaxID=3449428 RepID=UPI003F69507C
MLLGWFISRVPVDTERLFYSPSAQGCHAAAWSNAGLCFISGETTSIHRDCLDMTNLPGKDLLAPGDVSRGVVSVIDHERHGAR